MGRVGGFRPGRGRSGASRPARRDRRLPGPASRAGSTRTSCPRRSGRAASVTTYATWRSPATARWLGRGRARRAAAGDRRRRALAALPVRAPSRLGRLPGPGQQLDAGRSRCSRRADDARCRWSTGPAFGDAPSHRYGWLVYESTESDITVAAVAVARRLAALSARYDDPIGARTALMSGLRAAPSCEDLWRDALQARRPVRYPRRRDRRRRRHVRRDPAARLPPRRRA